MHKKFYNKKMHKKFYIRNTRVTTTMKHKKFISVE